MHLHVASPEEQAPLAVDVSVAVYPTILVPVHLVALIHPHVLAGAGHTLHCLLASELEVEALVILDAVAVERCKHIHEVQSATGVSAFRYFHPL